VKQYDVFIFGNISIDIIKTPNSEVKMTGGAVLYASWVAHKLGYNIGILTKISKAETERLKMFPNGDTDIYVVPSTATTSILNDYKTADKERRICTGLGMADPYEKEDFPEFKANVIQYSGLLQGEIDLELIKFLSQKGKLAVDAQGLLRKVNSDKSMNFVDFADLRKALPHIYYFKADAAEAEHITGITTESEEGRILAAKKIHEWGAEEVVISHNQALISLVEGKVYKKPFKNKSLDGRTGRGDTSFTTYILKRQKWNPEKTLEYSAALTSMKMEVPGPFKGTSEDVERFIESEYK